jgi:hypothetical protein
LSNSAEGLPSYRKEKNCRASCAAGSAANCSAIHCIDATFSSSIGTVARADPAAINPEAATIPSTLRGN